MTEEQARDFINELRQCAWIAHTGFFCCISARDLTKSEFPNNFLALAQRNAYMCAVLWWVALFGNKSLTYQYSKNFKRDFRTVCNKRQSYFPQCAGEKVELYLINKAQLDEDKYFQLRERTLNARNNFFAHVNPTNTVHAEDLQHHENMFGGCMELVIVFLDDVSSKFPSLKRECENSKRTIREYNAQVVKDYDLFFELLNRS